MSLQLGHVLDGKYRIVRVIGEGGMGAVYEGENLRIKRRVAIKLLHAGVASNTEMVQRFEREAQVAGTVGNDHILEILDMGALPDGERYMVMEFLDGETLTERIKLRSRLQPKEATAIVRQVLRGLAAAHGAGIVHRDLKPDNIFVLKEKAGVRDYVKIIDFGISKFTEGEGASSRMTRTGALMGTPHYMAPEQATGSAEIDRRTDIYAVGIILYEAVTGRVPFQAETFNQLLFEIALAKLIPARQYVPDLDPAFDSIIMRASARDPAQRFQTCVEFIAALDEWERTGSAVSLPPEQSIEAIVAATVPRAAPMPSASALESTLGSEPGRASSVPSGSVGTSVTAVSAGVPLGASTPLKGPTVNTWANSSQASAPTVSRAPLVAATAVGICLLVGVIGGFVLRSRHGAPSDPAAAASNGASVAAAIPTPAVTVPIVTPVTAAPAASAPAPATSEAETPKSGVPVVGAAHHTGTVAHPAVHEATEHKALEPPKVDKPKEKTINFGY